MAVDGQAARVLSPFEDLGVESLLAGRWRLRITWNGEPVLEVPEFELRGTRNSMCSSTSSYSPSVTRFGVPGPAALPLKSHTINRSA